LLWLVFAVDVCYTILLFSIVFSPELFDLGQG
jgi:hypothetical protein